MRPTNEPSDHYWGSLSLLQMLLDATESSQESLSSGAGLRVTKSRGQPPGYVHPNHHCLSNPNLGGRCYGHRELDIVLTLINGHCWSLVVVIPYDL